jgi:hypothetical protein
MKTSLNKPFCLILLMLFLQGCTIAQRVVRIDSNKEIDKLYVLKNDKVLMAGFHPELISQLNELGFATETYSGSAPESATYYINYTANWTWSMATYLRYFKASVYENGSEAGFSKLVGEVEYDATNGSGNMDKFGTTASKIRPLLQELFSKVKRKLPTL